MFSDSLTNTSDVEKSIVSDAQSNFLWSWTLRSATAASPAAHGFSTLPNYERHNQ
jgi:hypothetical protein